jgi:hypothetical protein
MTLRYWLNRYRRRATYYIRAAIWRLRMRAAYHLVGDYSFVANIEVVGALYMPKIRFYCPAVRDIHIFETEAHREAWKNGGSK